MDFISKHDIWVLYMFIVVFAITRAVHYGLI